MILDGAFSRAIVAKNDSLRVAELRGHWLCLNRKIEITKLYLHVDNTLVADGTLVRRMHIIIEAVPMNAVPAFHEHNGFGRGEHVLATDGTIAVCRSFKALVVVHSGYRNAGHAPLPRKSA